MSVDNISARTKTLPPKMRSIRDGGLVTAEDLANSIPVYEAENKAASKSVIEANRPSQTNQNENRIYGYNEKTTQLIEQIGEIIPPEHEFSQLINQIVARLDPTGETKIVPIDSDKSQAAYIENDDVIIITTGLLRSLSSTELVIKEDHIASIIAHELQHKTTGNRLPANGIERSHTMASEELRADVDGMTLLAKSGYNPKASIEALDCLSKIERSNGLDTEHLKPIDRTRHLEERFFDDEHPISNSELPMTALSEEVTKFIGEGSHIYDATETALSLEANALQEKCLSSTNLAEFWTYYQLERPARRIETAKALSEDEQVKLLARHEVLLKDISSLRTYFSGGKLTDLELKNEQIEGIKNLNPKSSDAEFENEMLNRVLLGNQLLATIPYQENLGKAKVDESVQTAFSKDIVEVNQRLRETITNRLNYLDSLQDLPQEYKNHLDMIRQLFNDPAIPVTTDVYLSAFSDLSQQISTREAESLKQKHNKAHINQNVASNIPSSLEANPELGEKLLHSAEINLSGSLLKDLPINEAAIGHLANLLQSENHLTPQESVLMANYLTAVDTESWFSYLRQYPRENLAILHEKIKNLEPMGNLRDSPRTLGNSFHQSKELVDSSFNNSGTESLTRKPKSHPFTKTEVGSASLSTMVAWELYCRALPTSKDIENIGARDDIEHYQIPTYESGYSDIFNGVGMDLSPSEWQLIIKSLSDSNSTSLKKVEDQHKANTLSNYVQMLRQGKPISPDQKTELAQLDNLFSSKTFLGDPLEITYSDALLLFENSPWPPKKRAIILAEYFRSHMGHENNLILGGRQKLAEVLTTLYNDYPSENSKQWSQFDSNAKDGLALEIFSAHLPRTIEPTAKEQTILSIFDRMKNEGVKLNLQSLDTRMLAQLSDQALEQLSQIVESTDYDNVKQFLSAKEYLLILAKCPNRREKKFDIYTHPKDGLLSSLQPIELIGWLEANIHPGIARDTLLTAAAERLTDRERERNYPKLIKLITTEDSALEAMFFGERANYFDTVAFELSLDSIKRDRSCLEPFAGKGRHRENFSDLLARRSPFNTLGNSTPGNEGTRSAAERIVKNSGSPTQRLLSEQLYSHENEILDQKTPLEQRVDLLKTIVPFKSAARDSYIEFMLQDTWKSAATVEDRIKAAEMLHPLFSETCKFKGTYAVKALRDTISTNLDFFSNPDLALTKVLNFLPESSQARNHFLDQIELKSRLTPSQIRQLISLRMTDEGQKNVAGKELTQASPETFYFGQLGSFSREEKSQTLLWLTGSSPTKPDSILKIENRYFGSLDSLRIAFAGLTPNERSIILNRMLLGENGVFDLESVSESDLPQATKTREEFISAMTKSFIQGDSHETEIFRNIFKTIFTESHPARAAKILTSLIDLGTENQLNGKVVSTEENLAQALSQCGIVGKKIAQSLAEMDWVPQSYKNYLKESQENADSLFQRALLTYEETAGLLDDSAPFTIISNKLLGAASNKQAAEIECRINSPEIAEALKVEVGQTATLIGKFKRPSAQKSGNLEQDLKILDKVLQTIRESGFNIKLPPGYAEQIKRSITDELNFKQEEVFATKLREDIKKRGNYLGYSVTIPQIFFSNPDMVCETKAKGSSLRAIINGLEKTGHSKKDINKQLSKVNAVRFREQLGQIVVSGDVHGDAHPGNIFVDFAESEMTFIDMGMNVEMSPSDLSSIRKVAVGLILGSSNMVTGGFESLGWSLPDKELKLRPGLFAANSNNLLDLATNAPETPPDKVGKLIVAISKLENASQGVSLVEVVRVVKSLIPAGSIEMQKQLLAAELKASLIERLLSALHKKSPPSA